MSSLTSGSWTGDGLSSSLTGVERGSKGTTTFFQNLSIPFQKVVNTIAVDSTGKFIVLGGKKGLFIVDLDEPHEALKTLTLQTQHSKWEVTTLEWNPHSARRNYIASTANQNTLIWDVEEPKNPLQATLQTHQRAVSDLSWSLFDPNILATCSADTFINLWDVRDPKKPIKRESFCGWTAGATQVKWNRKNPMTLASAHNGEVRIWDIRKVSSPTTFITAHMAKIYGIDWSYTEENDLVTCSEDKQVKFWNITMPRVCKGTLQQGVPVLRARYTPFGHGLVTMAQRGDNILRLWSLHDLNNPVRQYIGHTDIMTAFDWRIIEVNGVKEYQLVTWSKDQNLKLWYVDRAIQEMCKDKDALTIPTQLKALKDSTIISPVDKFSPSPYGLKDLAQEFSMLERKKPRDIVIEELSTAERTCVASVVGTPLLKLKIVFPAMYPHDAAPSFQFLPTNVASTHMQARIIESLTETALFHVENNRPCLYQCLCSFVLMLKGNDDKDTLLKSTSSPKLPVSFDHEAMPSPRTSGACFGPTGVIVYFNALKKRGSFAPKFRTYKDLKAHMQDLRGSSAIEDGSFFPISSYFYSPQMQSYRQELSVPAAPITLRGSPDHLFLSSDQLSNKIVKPIDTVYIRDVSYLQPVDVSLGKAYKLTGEISDICAHNAKAAEQAERKDLVKIWTMLGLILDPSIYRQEHPNVVSGIPWAYQPMGRLMIQSIFNHYERLRDVQTLALLACVLSIDPPELDDKRITSRPSAPSLQVVKEKHEMTTLLNPAQENVYDQYKNFYAELLYRWGLLEERAEILKFAKNIFPSAKSIGVGFATNCRLCGKSSTTDHACNLSGRSTNVACVICRSTVKGLSSFCLLCAHGGHAEHMREWFKTESLCPTGCGCVCLETTNSYADD